MLLQPKDRSISLTLHSDIVKAQQGVGAGAPKKFGQEFLDKYLPTGSLTGYAATTGLNAIGLVSPALTLTGPQSIRFGYSVDVAIEKGLFTSFMQPWFIAPIEIEIMGESYIGTFPVISKADADISGVLEMLHTVANDFSGINGTPADADKAVLLEIRNNPRVAKSYLGFLRKFEFGEKVENPYLLDYNIGFVGIPMGGVEISTGRQRGQRAKLAVGA